MGSVFSLFGAFGYGISHLAIRDGLRSFCAAHRKGCLPRWMLLLWYIGLVVTAIGLGAVGGVMTIWYESELRFGLAPLVFAVEWAAVVAGLVMIGAGGLVSGWCLRRVRREAFLVPAYAMTLAERDDRSVRW
ncbi:MAG: hypothetical protein EA423_11730 [Phycisphaerales bacterium]|nr:MAG: hypothetical protein EA423_11730 [Phycisphaerales bacterium]